MTRSLSLIYLWLTEPLIDLLITGTYETISNINFPMTNNPLTDLLKLFHLSFEVASTDIWVTRLWSPFFGYRSSANGLNFSYILCIVDRYSSYHRLNVEEGLQSLFGLHVT